MRSFINIILLALFSIPSLSQMIINHTCTDIHSVPDNWIDSAQNKLNVFYGHASHGSHLTLGGMTALKNFSEAYSEKYDFNDNGENGALRIIEPWFDLTHDEDNWFAITEQYLADYPQINVVMWAWSGIYEVNIQAYFTQMETLTSKYGPGGTEGRNVHFVFQTGNSKAYSGDENRITFENNEMIRDYCLTNQKILFDFNDIECYDPDGNYFGDGDSEGNYTGTNRLDQDCSYKINSSTRGNWGNEWVNANSGTELAQLSTDNICTSCAHSMGDPDDNSRLHCVLKGMAAWHLFARLAGWSGNGVIVSSEIDEDIIPKSFINIQPNPSSGLITIMNKIPDRSDIKLILYSLQGQPLMSIKLEKGIVYSKVDISHLDKGIYYLKDPSDNQINVIKILLTD